MTATNKTATTNNTKNVDFFQSSRTLSTRTAEFFRCVIKKEELKVIYGGKIATNNASIASIDDMLSGNDKGHLEISEEKLNEMRENYVSINKSLQAEWDKLVAEQATFEYTAGDKAFKKAIKKATSIEEVRTACRSFFRNYKLIIDDTAFEKLVLESIGQKINNKKLVTTNGTKCMVYDATNALRNMYGVSFEKMVEAGTIKPAMIPSVLVDKYAKKNKKNK